MEEVQFKVIGLKDENSFQSIEDDLKQLEKPRATEIALDIDRARTALKELQQLQKEALASGNSDLANKIGAQVELAKKQVTTLGRALTNFQRTGNENISILGQMFGDVGNKMKQMFAGVSERLDTTYIELTKIGKNTEGIELLRKKAEDLKSQLESGAISMKDYVKGLEKIGTEVQGVLTTLQNGGGILGQFNGMLSKFGLSVGSLLGGWGIKETAGYFLNLGDKAEQASISFEVMLGSADKAKKMLGDLNNLAKESSFFELQGLRDSTKQLIAMGIPAEKMIKTLRMLGDVAAGTGAPLEQIAYAYGQINTARKATTQDLNQLVNAGVPIWEELGRVVGKTAAEVKGMVGRRQIDFSDVEQAFENLTSSGGRFANLMQEQSKTLTGQWNAFKDSVNAVGEKIGGFLIPVAKGGIQTFDGLLSTIIKIGEWFTSTQGKMVLFGTAILGLTGLLGAFTTGAITLSGALTTLGVAKLFATASTWSFSAALTALWASLSPILLAVGAGILAVSAAITGLVGAWGILQSGLQLVGKAFQAFGEWLNIESIKKFGETIEWAGKKVQEFGKWIWGGIKGVWDWATGTDKATKKTEELGNAVENTTKKVEAWEQTIQKTEESLTGLQKATEDVDNMFKNLQNTVNNLIAEKEKLREQFKNGEITANEYALQVSEVDQKLQEARASSDEFSKALQIVEADQLTYMERVAQMNALNLNSAQYNVLIQKLRQVAREAYNALQLKAQLLDQAIKNPGVQQGVKTLAKTIIPGANIAGAGLKIADKFTGGKATKIVKQGQKKLRDAIVSEYKKTINKTQDVASELQKIESEAIKAEQKAIADAQKSKNNGGGGGKSSKKGGGGGKSKADQEEKKRLEEIKKKEEELAKIRTNAYKEANKRVEKFSEVVKNSNKKLEEQKKKLTEIKKQAEEVIKDLDEKLIDNQASFEEKLSERYKGIIADLKSELGDFAKSFSDENLINILKNGQIGGGDIEKLREELELLESQIDGEKLQLAIKESQKSETEKITEEYQKQKELIETSLKMQEAIKEGRFLSNKDGSLSFLDEEGKIIEAKNRNQQKEFEAEAKKIQDIANEELKIFQEKNEKISEIMKQFEEEKRVLNEEYFEKDKEMRLQQHRMMEEFFAKEIAKMEELSYLASSFNKNLSKTENSSKDSQNSASVSENPEISEKTQNSKNIFKNEEKILTDRSQKNAEILQKFHDIVAKIEGGITSTTESEINRRMSLYAQEEARLNALIAKRIQAGYAIASVPREFQNVNNTTNHSATINVNATSGGNIDANQLANTIMRKVQNYHKGIK